jgi:tetratricopeptide (TPR) repeat protein
MLKLQHPLIAVTTAILLSACGASPPPPPPPPPSTTRDVAALDSVTSAIIGHPVTTASADARSHFLAGQRELDLGRAFDALDHFQRAVAADSTFAFGFLSVANTSNSLADFQTNLARAERLAGGASEAEQLQIQIVRKGFENDVSGQLALAEQLVAKFPESPRAYLVLGGVQTGLNRTADGRASYAKAITLAPRLVVAHINIGTTYLFNEPRDFNQALEHFKHAEALAPNEPSMHDFLGDAYRALNDMSQARREYTRGHELNPRDAGLVQQRGHVNSFAGDYPAARADYDTSMALGRGNERGFFAPFRAYVSVYAGDPAAAIAELNQLATQADGMGLPDPLAVKVNALTNVALIGIDTRNYPAADAALAQRTPLMRQQSDQGGSAGFRRAQDANVAYFKAWLAARKGEYATARRETNRLATIIAPDANPRKMEPVHQLRGFLALYQGRNAEAAEHFAQGNLLDPYIKYHYAMALEGSGQAEKAKPMFRALAVYNFNSLGYALIRKEAQQMAL